MDGLKIALSPNHRRLAKHFADLNKSRYYERYFRFLAVLAVSEFLPFIGYYPDLSHSDIINFPEATTCWQSGDLLIPDVGILECMACFAPNDRIPIPGIAKANRVAYILVEFKNRSAESGTIRGFVEFKKAENLVAICPEKHCTNAAHLYDYLESQAYLEMMKWKS